jgi:Ca2+-binding EF-hand superfamily protein
MVAGMFYNQDLSQIGIWYQNPFSGKNECIALDKDGNIFKPDFDTIKGKKLVSIDEDRFIKIGMTAITMKDTPENTYKYILETLTISTKTDLLTYQKLIHNLNSLCNRNMEYSESLQKALNKYGVKPKPKVDVEEARLVLEKMYFKPYTP